MQVHVPEPLYLIDQGIGGTGGSRQFVFGKALANQILHSLANRHVLRIPFLLCTRHLTIHQFLSCIITVCSTNDNESSDGCPARLKSFSPGNDVRFKYLLCPSLLTHVASHVPPGNTALGQYTVECVLAYSHPLRKTSMACNISVARGFMEQRFQL